MPRGKQKFPPADKKESNDKGSKQQALEVVGRARSDFWRLLEERGESTLVKFRPLYDFHTRGLFHDLAKLVSVLTKHTSKRTDVEQLLIADEIANTSVAQDLGISPAHIVDVARRATVVKYAEKSCIIREGQPADSYYLVLEGSLKQEKVIGFTEAEDNGGREILFANIVQAINIAGADVSGTSDPYVCVRVGTREERSKTLTGTLQPIWDEVLRVEVDADDESVLIALYDDDAWGDDDYLGSVEVQLEPLRQKKHFYHNYSMNLEADDRFVAAADEEGTTYSVCGTIIFHLKLTTQAALDKLAKIEESEPDLSSLNRFVSGQSFGHEMMQEDGVYPFTLNVEFECTLFTLTKEDHDEFIRPLQDTDTDRLIELFSEMLPFHLWNVEKLQNFRKLVHVRRYKTGDVISAEGDTISTPMFVLSGEVYAFKKLPTISPVNRLKFMSDADISGSRRSLFDGRSQPSPSTELALLLQPTPERIGNAFIARNLRGDTIHFAEMLHARRNAYTTVAATPVEIVASNRMKVAHNEKCLIVYRGEGLNPTREVIVDSATCETLCKREVFHDQESKSILQIYTHDREWKHYKERLVSNIVFEHRVSAITRGPAKEPRFAERKVTLQKFCNCKIILYTIHILNFFNMFESTHDTSPYSQRFLKQALKSPDRTGLAGSFQFDVITEPKLPSLYENAYKGPRRRAGSRSASPELAAAGARGSQPDAATSAEMSRYGRSARNLDRLLSSDSMQNLSSDSFTRDATSAEMSRYGRSARGLDRLQSSDSMQNLSSDSFTSKMGTSWSGSRRQDSGVIPSLKTNGSK